METYAEIDVGKLNYWRGVSDIECKVSFERLRRPQRHVLNVEFLNQDKIEVNDVVRWMEGFAKRSSIKARSKRKIEVVNVVRRKEDPVTKSLFIASKAESRAYWGKRLLEEACHKLLGRVNMKEKKGRNKGNGKEKKKGKKRRKEKK